MKKLTHIGNIIGIAYRAGYKKQYKFRETKRHFVDEFGNKYSKLNGCPVGERFATSKLDICSLKEITNEN